MIRLIRCAVALALFCSAFAAQAAFHFMSIREVYAGSLANPDSQYVLLQMRQASQNNLLGHSVYVYNAAGTQIQRTTFSAAVPNGANQAFVLIATSQAQTEFGVTPNLLMTPSLLRAGGRVCFDNYDCVAWGAYTGPSNRCTASNNALTAGPLCETGTPFRNTEGLAPGRAARRDISRGNPNVLEPTNNTVTGGIHGDDTGSSAADFFYAANVLPINNGNQVATAPLNGTGIDLPDFDSTADLRLTGAVAQAGVLRLTPLEAATPAAFSAWHRLRQDVNGGFQTRFRFRITPNGGDGAEGFAFVIQNESNSSLGASGAALGYGGTTERTGITNSLAVEFDTRSSSSAEGAAGDPAFKHVSIHSLGRAANSAGQSASLAVSAALTQLDDGAVHTAFISYPAGGGALTVTVDGVVVAQATVNLATLLDLTNGAAFVGFTSGSGPGLGDHDLLSWQFAQTLPDECVPGRIAFSRNFLPIAEGARRSIEVQRLGGSCGAVSVDYAATPGTATAGVDYSQVTGTGTLSWEDGDASPRRSAIITRDDTQPEPPETILLGLANAQGGATLDANPGAVVRIVDNDGPPQVSISGPASASEGDADVLFTVSLSAPLDRNVIVRLGLGGSAVRGSDYRFSQLRVDIPAGALDVTRPLNALDIDIIDDAVVDPGEMIELRIDSVVNAEIGASAQLNITILDND